MDEMKRERIIAYLRHRMAEFGINPEDLAPEQVERPQVKVPTVERYRSASGGRWDGEGKMPEWLRRARSACQSIDHFEVSPALQARSDRQASANGSSR